MRRSIPFAACCAALLALSACQDAATPVSAPDPPAAAVALALDSGYVMRDGTPIRVVFEVRDGRAVYEGDIDLGPVAEIPRSVDELRRRSRVDGGGPQLGVVSSSSSRRWGNGVVPYVIEGNVANPSRITTAMANIEREVFGLDFVPRTSQGSWIIFRRTTDSGICGQSPVGRQGGGQVVLIHDNCGVGTAMHEIFHSLGVWHEQGRCDRDTYVEILTNNIESGRADQFDKHCAAATVFAYDEGSIMHYSSTAFGRIVNGVRLQTIRSRRGLDHLMGQRSVLSSQDIRTAVWMYPTAPVISPINWQNAHPVLSWRSTRAGTYDIYLVVEESWRTPFDGSGTSSWRVQVGAAIDTTFTDWTNPTTGVYSCDTSRDVYEDRWESYYYEVVAVYGYGVVRTGPRVGAAVARC